MSPADEAQTLGEVARGVERVESQLTLFRTEMHNVIGARVSHEAFEARMETVRTALEATTNQVAALSSRVQMQEDERDRTRLALTVAIITALVAPVVVALLLRGVA